MVKGLVKAIFATTILCTFMSAQDSFKLKLQSADSSGATNFKLQTKWAKTVGEMTNGKVKIEILPVNSIVKYSETLDAVAAGILEGHISSIAYFTGKDPGFALMGNSVGAWSDPNELISFMRFGGGNELMKEFLAPYGVTYVASSTTGLEAFVAKKPLKGVADLKGLKMRAPEGLVQAVFHAVGAAPVNLPYSEVFTSLDKGVIEAADAGVLAANAESGLHKIAKYPVYPGFHSIPLLDLSINTKLWNKIPKNFQKIIKVSFQDYTTEIVSTLKLKDRHYATEASAKKEIIIQTWPESEKAKFRRIAQKEWEKVSKQSPNAKKAYNLLVKYLKENGMI